MPKYEPIENFNVLNDANLLDLFNKKIDEVEFITPQTLSSIKMLRGVELHLQSDSLISIWKGLVGDAILFLKSHDKREMFHDKVEIPLGTEELWKFLKEFQSFEPILYGAMPNYRDHIAHVFRVFLLGHYIIKTAIGFDNISPSNGDLKISQQEKEAIWCILALTHDLGYSLEVIHHINQKVRGMLQQFGNIPIQELGYSYFAQFGTISDFTVKFFSSDIIPLDKKKKRFATHLQAKYYQKFLNALSNFDHGVISSTILMRNLVYFKESDCMLDTWKSLEPEDARQFLIRKEILRAIASHHCEDIYYLGIKNFPFLLTACDEMQEWGRPRLIDVTKRGGAETKLTINKFSDRIVDYKITFSIPVEYKASDEEINNARIEIKNYFTAKRDKWLNVLRSAVGGHHRDLVLNFEVEDDMPGKAKKYFLKHTNPEVINQG